MNISTIVKIFLPGLAGLVGLCFILSVSLQITEWLSGVESLLTTAGILLWLGVIGFFSIIGLKIAKIVI